MPNFNRVARASRYLETADYTIYGLQGMTPVLKLKPANDRNAAYLNAALKRQRQGRSGRGPRQDTATLQAFRNHDRDLYPKYVVTGWDGVLDDDDKVVSFSAEACAELFAKLPDDMIDDIRNFAADIINFVEDSDPEDVEAQAGN